MEKEDFGRIMKLLIEYNQQTLVSFLLKDKDASYQGELDREAALLRYKGTLNRELRERVLSADEIYHVWWKGVHMLLHLEFQHYGESGVPRKIWECNTLTSIITGKLVHSVVIYGVPESTIPEPVYEIRLPDGQVSHSFTFDQIKLWEIEPEVFEQPQFVRLLPLLPLMKYGQNRETVDRMLPKIEEVIPSGLMLKTSPVPQLALRSEQEWREWHDLIEKLFGDTPSYQEAIARGREEGFREVVEKSCLCFMEIRFPTLYPFAKQVMERGLSLQQLDTLRSKLYLANTLEEASAALQSV